MNAMLETLVRMPVSEALGWALFHSLWQGAIAAGLLAVFRGSRARYVAGCVALAAILCCFTFTFWTLLPEAGIASGAGEVATSARAPSAALAGPAGTMLRAGDLLAWLAPLWIIGVVLFQLRAAAGWMAARRLRLRGVCEASKRWRFTLGKLAARMRVSRPVQLLESGLAEVPVVVGYLRPVILVPAGLLSSMPPEHIELILLHELAHIRRHDYLVNLLQTVTEGLLFYHPAVWWISGVVRAEREHCCDDLAVAASSSGGAYEYALALTALEQSRWGTGSGRWNTAAGVAATGGKLMARIHRLLYPKHPAAVSTGAPLLGVVLAMLVAWQSAAAPQRPAENTDPYMKWVNEDVVYVIDGQEREAFLRLNTDAEREHFVEQFWQRRDPTPGTPQNEAKDEHYRRITYANERWKSERPGWQTDRGRIYIVYGPPDEIEAHPSGRGDSPPFEQWRYVELEGIGKQVIVEFVDAYRNGEYRQTTDPRKGN